MTEKSITKMMLGFQVCLAIIMLLCVTLVYWYHLIAGNFCLFTLCCFTALMIISYKMFRWSVAEYKEEMSKY